MFLVRAGVAYVDTESNFIFYDVDTEDPSDASLPPSKYLPNAASVLRGYRVEGIAAVNFEMTASDSYDRAITVWVLAEGDNLVTGRTVGVEDSASQAFRSDARWADVEFKPEVYYEEFSMRWRTRNIETPET
jgi:hypothetical protein